jgi:hypothetical protein
MWRIRRSRGGVPGATSALRRERTPAEVRYLGIEDRRACGSICWNAFDD